MSLGHRDDGPPVRKGWMARALGRRGYSSVGLRTLGLLFITIGLVAVSMALASSADGEGVIILFPFVIGNVGGWSAAFLTLAFFVIFVLTSIMPWYMISKRTNMSDVDEYITREKQIRGRGSDTLEYIITTELPSELTSSVYIEADGDEVHLRSTMDKDFLKSYSLPRGFEVDDYDYDFEESYLVIKLRLKKSR